MGINKPPREDTTEAACSLNIYNYRRTDHQGDFKMELLSRFLLRKAHIGMMLIKKPDEFRGILFIPYHPESLQYYIFFNMNAEKNRLHSVAKTHLLVATIALQKKRTA